MEVMEEAKEEVVMVQVDKVEVVLSPLWKYAGISLASCQEMSQSAKKSRGHVSAWIYTPFILPHPSLLPSIVLRGPQSAHLAPSPPLLRGASSRPTNGSRVGFDCGCRVWTLLPALPSSAPRSLRLIYRSKIPLH